MIFKLKVVEQSATFLLCTKLERKITWKNILMECH